MLSQRAADVATLAQRAQQLEALLAQALGSDQSAGGSAPAGPAGDIADALRSQMAALRAELASSLEEARATAAQAQAEVERQKRSSSQVGQRSVLVSLTF